MTGVKKSGKGRRAAKGGKRGAKKSAAAKNVRKHASAKKPAVAKTAWKTIGQKKARGTIMKVRDLDPYRKCGPGTSVERLIRVDELVDDKLEAHLVFLDRHGWYCEHGRACHAVGHARKHSR